MAARRGIRATLESAAAHVVAMLWYAVTLFVARLAPRRSPERRPSGRAVILGTFHNPGWYLSHARPLARSGLRELIVIAHGALPALDGVRCDPPPRWLRKAIGRTPSKFLWALRAGRKYDADVFIGYHVIPNGTMALVAARLLGRTAIYQMTGGPIELLGGGYLATDNFVVGRLGRPSPRLERMALAVARQFDLVVVRGRSAERFVRREAGARAVAVIPGSVDLSTVPSVSPDRPCDLVYVGRLAPTKQPLQFVEIVNAVRRRLPAVRARIVGDGPLMDEVRRRIGELQLDHVIELRGQVKQVFSCLQDARVFVLTSRSEGLSIAMVEAMVNGAVPVVANVGDLGDVVVDGESGYLIEPGNIEQYADRAASLITDDGHWRRLSTAAVRSARDYNGLDRIAALWNRELCPVTASCADTASVPAAVVDKPALAAANADLLPGEGPER